MVRKNLLNLVAGALMLVETSFAFGGDRDWVSYFGSSPLVYDGGRVIVDTHLENSGVYLFADSSGGIGGAKVYSKADLPKFLGIDNQGSVVATIPYNNVGSSFRYTIDSRANFSGLDVNSRVAYSDNGRSKDLKWESSVVGDIAGNMVRVSANGDSVLGCTRAGFELTVPINKESYVGAGFNKWLKNGANNFSVYFNKRF